jgi:hypothetical protein
LEKSGVYGYVVLDHHSDLVFFVEEGDLVAGSILVGDDD